MASRPLVLLFIAICGATLLTAQQPPAKPPQDPQRPPTFRTEANYVRVDVFATAKGSPVRNLTVDDFQVLEDGVPQKVSAFEYVQVRTGVPQEMRNEPNTIQQSRQELANPRARVFVLFLDVPHVSIDGTWNSRQALTRMVDRLMGAEDLIGVMTPRMSPADIVFARKTSVIEAGLLNNWPWGERHTIAEDDQDRLYKDCYPWPTRDMQDAVNEMIVRRKERATLDAFKELVTWLRDQREERKAILTVTEGWVLYRPNPDLMRLRVIDETTGAKEPIPGPEPIGVGPGGKITIGTPQMLLNGEPSSGRKSECDNERLHLSSIDDQQMFRDLMDVANRANASFYTIDPRGLAVFDIPLGPAPHPGLEADAASLKNRTEALRTLAENTDGLAVIGSNNLEPGLRRISDDLSSYYLLGYYSSNTKLDGRFRKVTVKITRPGVEVRARRGYKAAIQEEVSAARAAAAAVVPESMSAARDALGSLARLRPEAKLHTQAIAVRDASTTVWFTGELSAPVTGATTASVTVSSSGGTTSIDVPIAQGLRSFTGSLALSTAPGGPIDVRVRVAPPGEIPFTDGVRIDAVSGLSLPLMFRRGPSTGNRYEPAGQPQFSRTQRARFDIAATTGVSLDTVQVLDRNGAAIDVPVARTQREGWLSAEITLAALAPGDYLVELSGTSAGQSQKVLAAFRVTR
jgi:VWFA-related protein